MVMPGVTTRKPRVKRLLLGRRTAFTVCQAISIAITVVLPAPVASLSASRLSSGLASAFAFFRCSRKPRPTRSPGATSVSQIAVSIASSWQKNGRMPWNSWWRQCWRSRAVSGVTPQPFGFWIARHWSTCRRRSLMSDVRSYCCFAVESPWPSSRDKRAWPLACRCFFGLGIGVMNRAGRRDSMIAPVGMRSSSSSQCRAGDAYGELRIGRSWKTIVHRPGWKYSRRRPAP